MSTIVLDAGHGGSDPGAVSGARLEKDDNLNLALAVQRRLEAGGQRVVMTRDRDVFVPLAERSAISDRNHADMFVSIHRNAATSPAANGVENFVYRNPTPRETQNAQTVLDEVVRAGVQSDRGVKRGDFAVLRNTRAPAMLLEMGFITNARDNQLFDQNFNAYADAITRGILRALGGAEGPPVSPPSFRYTVVAGDTLWRLAQRFGTTVEAIMALNGLPNSNLSIGQVLRIPT
jgi:N-acetylmuramoyl-L-alanine amidase